MPRRGSFATDCFAEMQQGREIVFLCVHQWSVTSYSGRTLVCRAIGILWVSPGTTLQPAQGAYKSAKDTRAAPIKQRGRDG